MTKYVGKKTKKTQTKIEKIFWNFRQKFATKAEVLIEFLAVIGALVPRARPSLVSNIEYENGVLKFCLLQLLWRKRYGFRSGI